MPKRIFQQRLQDKLRHKRLVQGCVNYIGHPQFVLEAFLHQVEVQPCDLQFFRERNFMRSRSPQREPQQVAQLRDHRVRGAQLLGLRDPQSLVEGIKAHDDGEPDEVIRELHWVAVRHDAVIVRTETHERRKKMPADGHNRSVRRGENNRSAQVEEPELQPTFALEEVDARVAKDNWQQKKNGIYTRAFFQDT